MASESEMKQMLQALKESKEGCCSKESSCKDKKSNIKPKGDDSTSTRKKQILSLVFLVIMLGGAGIKLILSLIDGFYNSLNHMNISDQDLVKNVLFGGYPHLVICIYPKSPYKFDDSIAKEAAGMLIGDGIKSYTVNCSEKLPSGKTIPDRMNLPQSVSMFVTANGAHAKIVPPHLTGKADDLVEWVRNNTNAQLITIKTPKDFTSLCTSRDRCMILTSRSPIPTKDAKNLLDTSMNVHRKVRTVLLNTSKFIIQLDPKFLSTRPEQKNTLNKDNWLSSASMVCLAKNSSDNTYYGVFYKGDWNTNNEIYDFYELCEFGDIQSKSFSLLEKPVTILNRPPKATSTKQNTQPKVEVQPEPVSVKSSINNKGDDTWDELLQDIHHDEL